MSERNVEFHRLEGYELREHGRPTSGSVLCSFETERFGYLQVGFDEGGVYQLDQEPDLNMFTQAQQDYIECALAIAWRMVFDTPAATDRFER